MSTAPTKRACDACHRRKVRCNGSNPCQNCLQASLACTYNKPPQKKGPKGSRAKVISELRKSQEQASSKGLFSPLSGPNSPTFVRHDLLTPDLVDASIQGFFEKLYPTLPIMDQAWVQQKALEIGSSTESYCLIGSLCAFMIIQPTVQTPIQTPVNMPPLSPHGLSSMNAQHHQTQIIGIKLLEDVKRARGSTDYGENPTTASVLTAFLISAACFGLERHTTAWFHLQEAILFARMIRIHDEKSYGLNPAMDTMHRRLFWILYVSERAQALQKHRDLTFHETISFPIPSSHPLEAVAIPGLFCLFNLFRVVDSRVSQIWNNLRAEVPIQWPQDTKIWFTQLQQRLTAAIPEGVEITEIQEVDLRITQIWLRTVVWQLSTASGILSSHAEEEAMRFMYPMELAHEIVLLTGRVSLGSMEAHGIGLVEKLFDVAYTLIDVMAILSIDSNSPFETNSSRDHLAQILWLITTLRGGETRYATLLHAKIRETLPGVAAQLNIPPPASTPPILAQLGGLPQDDMSSVGTGSVTSSPYGSPGASHAMLATLPTSNPFNGAPIGAGGALGLGGRFPLTFPSSSSLHSGGGPTSNSSPPGSAPDSPVGGMSPVASMAGVAGLGTSGGVAVTSAPDGQAGVGPAGFGVGMGYTSDPRGF